MSSLLLHWSQPFIWAGFHHTYSKWQKGKLILLYLLWIIDEVLSPWTAVSFLSLADCHALLSFPVSSWESGESIHGEALYQKSDLRQILEIPPSWGCGWLFKTHCDCNSEKKLTVCELPVQLLLAAWQSNKRDISMIPSRQLKNTINVRKATELSRPTNNKAWHSFNGTCTSWPVAFVEKCIIPMFSRKYMQEGNCASSQKEWEYARICLTYYSSSNAWPPLICLQMNPCFSKGWMRFRVN